MGTYRLCSGRVVPKAFHLTCDWSHGDEGHLQSMQWTDMPAKKHPTCDWSHGGGGTAGYAADGYARINGAACVMVTFTVGSLSAVNAIAGAYSESLPIIIVTGVPNSNDYSSGHILHHTIGEEDFDQELR